MLRGEERERRVNVDRYRKEIPVGMQAGYLSWVGGFNPISAAITIIITSDHPIFISIPLGRWPVNSKKIDITNTTPYIVYIALNAFCSFSFILYSNNIQIFVHSDYLHI